jgi:hypothetical protein
VPSHKQRHFKTGCRICLTGGHDPRADYYAMHPGH